MKIIFLNLLCCLRSNGPIEFQSTMQRMILFYSEYCPHCRMLLDTVKRHDPKGMIKLACIETLRASGKRIPPQIHSVPALVLLPNKGVLYGKNVFDYLLLPGSGKLLVTVDAPQPKNPSEEGQPGPSPQVPRDPGAYSMWGNSLSDNFAMIDDSHPENTHGVDDRSYAWAAIEDPASASVYPDAPLQEETRSKKALPDLDSIVAHRAMDLKQSDINSSQLPPPSFTR
jgi:hypothetical protein